MRGILALPAGLNLAAAVATADKPSFTLAQANRTPTARRAAPSDEAKAAELAKKLQNPIASLISVPIQNNWDFGIGPADAMCYYVNIQPVIPFSLTKDWNLITRTIMPVIYADFRPVSSSE